MLGLMLPIGALGSEAGRLLTTFMGFFTAGVLPTISILIGSVSAAGRSVKALNDVHNDTKAAIGAMVGLLKLAGGTVAVLFVLSIAWSPSPMLLPSGSAVSDVLRYFVPIALSPQGDLIDLTDLIRRLGQVLVCCLTLLFVLRATSLPAILYDALRSKHELAVDEARRKIDERAPGASDVRKVYGASPEFGAVIRLEEKSL